MPLHAVLSLVISGVAVGDTSARAGAIHRISHKPVGSHGGWGGSKPLIKYVCWLALPEWEGGGGRAEAGTLTASVIVLVTAAET